MHPKKAIFCACEEGFNDVDEKADLGPNSVLACFVQCSNLKNYLDFGLEIWVYSKQV